MKAMFLSGLLGWVLLSAPRGSFGAELADASVPTAIIGIDHVPLVVGNLDWAAARYRQLGFALKPGRAHDNGLRNSHVKFPDGSGIELISPPLVAVDDLARHYVELLAQGEGPAFLSLHARDWPALQSMLRSGDFGFRDEGLLTLEDPDLDFLFFVQDNRSATDKPEHFRHANGAIAMTGVWLALGDSARTGINRLLLALGADHHIETVLAPDSIETDVYRVRNGRIVVLPERHQLRTGRPVIGAEFRVTDLSLVRQRSGSIEMESPDGDQAQRDLLPPEAAHGIWLEFHRSP